MRRSRLQAIALWLCAVLHLVAAPALASTVVLCVGERGHVEIETSLRDLCCPPESAPLSATQLEPDASCTDTPLVRAIGEPRAPGRYDQANPRSDVLPIALVSACQAHALPAVGRTALDARPRSDASSVALATVVLVL